MSLTRAQETAACMIGRGHSRREAALAAGCHERTVYVWQKKIPEFMERARAEQETIGEPRALDVLRTLLSSANESIRLGAAKALLTAPPEPPPPPGPPTITVYVREPDTDAD